MRLRKDVMTEKTSDVMAEPPNPNHGSKASTEPEKGGRQIPLDVATMLTTDLLRSEGFGVVETGRGSGRTGSTYGDKDAGMTTHRGVLHGDEYVDFFDLRAKVEAEFGFTYAEVSAAYKGGRPTADMRQMREQIDARMLALSHAGGSMITLAEALGLSEKTIDRALARARERHVEEIVKAPARTTVLGCFKCGEPGRRRKRAHSTSPADFVGTVVLCDQHYGEGFNTRPGNPAYWEHRLALTPLKSQGLKPVARREQKFPADWPSDESYADFLRGER